MSSSYSYICPRPLNSKVDFDENRANSGIDNHSATNLE